MWGWASSAVGAVTGYGGAVTEENVTEEPYSDEEERGRGNRIRGVRLMTDEDVNKFVDVSFVLVVCLCVCVGRGRPAGVQ